MGNEKNVAMSSFFFVFIQVSTKLSVLKKPTTVELENRLPGSYTPNIFKGEQDYF